MDLATEQAAAKANVDKVINTMPENLAKLESRLYEGIAKSK